MQRSSACCLLLVLALTHSLFAAEIPAKLVGRWRSLETSKGGIGAMLEFHADGTVDFSPGAVVESPYRLDGHQLILPSGTNGGPEQKTTIAFVGDKLRIGEGAATSQFTRKGAGVDPSNPIIGEWNGTRDMEGHQLEMRWLFYPSGKSLMLIPFLTDHGHFTTEGTTIRFEFARDLLPAGHFELNGDMLKLPGRKTVSAYARY
jgi:hypothetical protein